MSNTTRFARPPRALFLGMQGNFSHPPLRALLEAGIEVCAVIIPGQQHLTLGLPAILRREQPQTARSMLPLLGSSLHTSIVQLAWERQIPVWEVHRMPDPETAGVLATYQPDIICVACFSRRIPRTILDIPHLGCLNVHPSLLPANRGPEPLFWTFREGSQYTGVTIHLMDEGMDTGPMVAQEAVEVPDGIRYDQLEAQCAALGGTLLARSVWDLYHGLAVSTQQDVALSSYHGFPTEDDFVIQAAEWSARHIYNFICGVISWGTPITLLAGNQSLLVKKAISYSHKNIYNRPGSIIDQVGEELWVECEEGIVRLLRASEEREES